MEVLMNLSIKNIFLLAGLLCVAQLHAMTPEDRQAREERVKGFLGQFKSNDVEKAEANQGPEDSSVLAKRGREINDDEPDSKKAKLEEKSEEEREKRSRAGLEHFEQECKKKEKEEKNEVMQDAAVILPADANKYCGFVDPGLPAEILLMVAGKLDLASYRNLKSSCNYFDFILNDEKAIQEYLISEIRSRGHENTRGSLYSYFPECMKTSDIEVQDLNEHDHRVELVVQLRDGNLASCSNDGIIKIWNPNTHKCLRTLLAHDGHINSIIQLRDENLASCSDDGTIKIWNPNTGECLHVLVNEGFCVNSIIQLRDGSLAAGLRSAYFFNGAIKIWSLDTYESLFTLNLENSIRSIIQCGNGNIAFICSSKMKILNLETHEVKELGGGWSSISDFRLIIGLRNGDLAACFKDNKISIWDLNNYNALGLMSDDSPRIITSIIELRNKNLVSCSADKKIRIWNSNSYMLLHRLEGHAHTVISAIELRDGSLASCSFDKTIRIWNSDTGQCLCVLEGHDHFVKSVIQLKNGNLASCSSDGMIKIWNIYPENLSAQQIYLVLRLSKYADHNEKVQLDAFWSEIYNSLPDYLKERYGRAIIS